MSTSKDLLIKANVELQKTQHAFDLVRAQVASLEQKHALLRSAREDLTQAQNQLAQARERREQIEGNFPYLQAESPRIWIGFHMPSDALAEHYKQHALYHALMADWPRVEMILAQKVNEAQAAVDALAKELGALPAA